jgi:hypothetical protein
MQRCRWTKTLMLAQSSAIRVAAAQTVTRAVKVLKCRSPWRGAASRVILKKFDHAQSELPDRVDTDQHIDLLVRCGVKPPELMGKLAAWVMLGS